MLEQLLERLPEQLLERLLERLPERLLERLLEPCLEVGRGVRGGGLRLPVEERQVGRLWQQPPLAVEDRLLCVEAQVELEAKFESGSSYISFKRGHQARSTWGQLEVKPGSNWVDPGVYSGSTQGQPGINPGSARG